MSRRLRSPRNTSTGNAAAEQAQTSRDDVARGRAIIVGKEPLDGRQTVHLRELVRPVPTLPSIHVDMWVDPLTYVTVRTRFTVRGHSSITDETWLPRTAANVAATKIVIPTGFKRRRDEGTLLTSTDSARLSGHCA